VLGFATTRTGRKETKMKPYRIVIAAGLACAAIVVLAPAGAAGPQPSKQRISIVAKMNTNTFKGTFQLFPLTGGSLKGDKGSFTAGGDVNGPVLRNGQRVTLISGRFEITGKLGTLRIVQKVTQVAVGAGFTSDTGTWTLKGLTGGYVGVTGSGRFAGVSTPAGFLYATQEGFVSKS
jgi:hypothetical protein